MLSPHAVLYKFLVQTLNTLSAIAQHATSTGAYRSGTFLRN